MIKLTTGKLEYALFKTYKSAATYLKAEPKFYRSMLQLVGKKFTPKKFVETTGLTVEQVFSKDHPPIVKELIFLNLPDFYKNLELGDDEDETIAYFEEIMEWE